MSRGFTLLELILVMGLLVVLAALTVPNFKKFFEQTKIKNIANNISYLMQYAQSRAVTQNKMMRLTWDEVFSQYWLEEEIANEKDVRMDTAEPVFQKISGRRGRMSRIPSDISIYSEKPNVEFFTDGRIEKMRMRICPERMCHDKVKCELSCMTISTHEQRAKVSVFEENFQPEM
ncbi:MAG: prepilin-type N-terminal cleavage/methylation domain-containing protein [Candidatus Omnitrophica bacterium]|nr:prepilin-type N-terminal cleavage/methylation domain-containing protein [Candidatus Omnitrophota bacterium]